MSEVNWSNQFVEKFTAGIAHAFILTGNVFDYVVPGVTLKKYLSKMLAGSEKSPRQIVLFYNRSEGITFPTKKHKAAFIALLGLDKQQDEVLAALNGTSGNGDVELPKNPEQALPLIEQVLRNPSAKSAVVIEYAETIAPNADVDKMPASERTVLVTLQRWASEPELVSAGNPILLVAKDAVDLHSNIRAASSKWELLNIPLPAYEDRLNFVNWYMEQRNGFKSELNNKELASVTAGLGLVHIEDIFLRAAKDGRLTYELVRQRKEDIIKSEYGEVLEIIDPTFGFEAIGGKEYIKNFFRKSVIKPMREGRFNRVPMGILLIGPAGTGKTVMAHAVAFESSMNFVILNPAKLFGQYVGNTERNLEKALQAIESLSPCGVLLDEVDQMLSRGSGGDSGVGARFFKRLLEFMADGKHRGKIIFLAATNRPDLMDAALKRPGRFDKKVPFLVPDDEERSLVFEVMGKRYGLALDEKTCALAASKTEGYTGAEIEALVVKAVEVVEDYEVSASEALARAIDAISPSTADIEFMTTIALKECNDKDLLPPRYRAIVEDADLMRARVMEANQQIKDLGLRGNRSL